MKKACLNQNGFALISALFVVIVLATLGGYMVKISGVQNTVPVSALQGERAFNAARSGIEWASYIIRNAPNPPAACSNLNGNTISFSGAGLVNFSTLVNCTLTNHTEGSIGNFGIITLVATARSGSFGDPDYVERVIRTSSFIK